MNKGKHTYTILQYQIPQQYGGVYNCPLIVPPIRGIKYYNKHDIDVLTLGSRFRPHVYFRVYKKINNE